MPRELRRKKSWQKKYRYLKFIERQKTERKLSKARAKLAKMFSNDGKETNEEKGLRKQISQLVADLDYIKNFPKDKKYVSLYPSGGSNPEHNARVEKIRKLIESQKNRKVSGATTTVDEDEEDSFFKEADSDDDEEDQEIKSIPPKKLPNSDESDSLVSKATTDGLQPKDTGKVKKSEKVKVKKMKRKSDGSTKSPGRKKKKKAKKNPMDQL
mmetsp:Transcript_24561/g.47976  ORF Transcript_24561/g.47976 Transcript_24561/m.47976 type:complete len:212 (-) Transcript_24561:206-841(-)